MKDYRISLLADFYGEMLTPRALEIVRRCYDDDLSLGEVAELMRISRQAVSETLNKATGLLLEYEEKLGLLAFRERALAALEAGLAAAERGDYPETIAALERLRALI